MKKVITLVLLAALLAGLGLAAIAAESAKGGTIRLEENSGTVSVVNASGKAQTVRSSMRLYNGYKVSTGTKSEAYISLDDSKVVKLDASTKVDVKQSGKQLEVSLSSGKLFFNVTRPLKADETLNITSSTMVTGIRGSYGWVTPTEVGLMHGHVTVTCRNPYTGETRVTELFSGERVYFDPDPQVVSADPALKEIDFIKEPITNGDVPAIVVREMKDDQEGLCDPVIDDVPTVDVPELLASLPELEQKEREEEAEAEQAMQKALREEEASMSGDAVDQVFESSYPADGGDDSGSSSSGSGSSSGSETPPETKYTVTLSFPSSVTVSASAAETSSGSGQYEVTEGEEFVFTVIPDSAHAVFNDDIGVALESGTELPQKQVGSNVECSVTVTNDVTITCDRIYAIESHIDQTIVDDEPYIAAVDATMDSSVSLPSGSVIRVPEGGALIVTGTGTTLTVEDGADLNIEGSFVLEEDATLINYSTSSVHVFMNGVFTQNGSIENYGRIYVEGEISGAGSYGGVRNTGTFEVAEGGKADIKNVYNGEMSYAAHDDRATLKNGGDLSIQMLVNNGTIANSGTMNVSYTVTNCYQITNDGTFNNEAAMNNGDSGFDPEWGYGTFINNGTFVNNHTLKNYSFNTFVNNGTFNNTIDGYVKNSGSFSNEGAISNQGSVISVGPLDGSGSVSGTPVDETGKYVFRFDNNGGYGVTTGDYELEPGETVAPKYSPPDSSLLKKDGYTLTGWCSDRACTNEWNIKTDPVQSDMVLYARWE